MKRFALVAILLAACGGAHAAPPRDSVLRLLVPRNPHDACSQFTDAYRRQLDAQFGKCLDIMETQPKATHIRFSAERVRGDRASLHVAYDFRGRRLREVYSLVRIDGRWRVRDAELLH